MRLSIVVACLVTVAGCRGPCPWDQCPPVPSSSCEPHADRAGPPACERSAERCYAPPQRVIIEVIQKSAPAEKPAAPVAALPPPAPVALPAPPAAPAVQYVPVGASPAVQTMQALQSLQAVQLQAVPAVASPVTLGARLGLALDFFRLPLPYLRPVIVPAEREAPQTVLLAQQPSPAAPALLPASYAAPYAPPLGYGAPPQYVQVPLTGTGLVPAGSLPVAACPPVQGPQPPALRADAAEELCRQIGALKMALEAQKKAAGSP